MGSYAAASQAQIAKQYQNVASTRVINAVANASARSGVDFKFLMEKASTESSFDPSAKSKSSSATGLYQFIDQTWLNVVKAHGDKYGLGDYADKIEIMDGKACVDDSATKKQILALRQNPEISACMAGEFSADNAAYLQDHTQTDVGSTELYLAHFMGAGGAAKFINARDFDGSADAAKVFPAAAKANKNVFFDHSGKVRSLDQVYDLFSKKFSGGQATGSSTVSASTASQPTKASATASAAATPHTHGSHLKGSARTLPVFDDANEADDIIWNDDPRFKNHQFTTADFTASSTPGTGFSHSSAAVSRLSPYSIMAMSQMSETLNDAASGQSARKTKHWNNS